VGQRADLDVPERRKFPLPYQDSNPILLSPRDIGIKKAKCVRGLQIQKKLKMAVVQGVTGVVGSEV